uniref:IRS-type PTB domain-containing protein n=1 Tax=Meloidogyne hapla TaxID=6305 RepID=A0A1I8B469_MELHA
MPTWGLVQNALTGEYFLSTADKLPDVFWVRISKNKLHEVFNAVKNMECVSEDGEELHPFGGQPEDENMMQPIWQQQDGESMELEIIEESSVVEQSSSGGSYITEPEWFSPAVTSTPIHSPVSIYSANSSPALIRDPYLADFLNEDDSFF